MAYLGSTQLSSVANPPVMMYGIVGQGADSRITGSTFLAFNNYNQSSTNVYREGQCSGGRLWHYFTTDVTTAVIGTGYFSDAGPLGMRPFDIIFAIACGTSNSTASVGRMVMVTSVTTAGAAVVTSGFSS